VSAERFRIYLFGEPRFELGGEPYRFNAPPKTLPLFAYLLLHRRGPVARESLAALLWPDADQPTAYSNLRRHLHYLTKALPAAPAAMPWVLTTKSSIAWNVDAPYWLDVEAFETQSAEGHSRAHAVRLYSGDLYERCSEEWIDFERERLRTLQISNLAQLCGEAQTRSSYIEALQYAQLMLASDPWREDAVRTIMETRMLLGDRSGAMAEYERFVARLRDELNTRPLAETTQAYERIARSTAGAAAQGANAAARSTTLIGRRNELATLRAEWQRAARGEGRAVFLGGEAGIGKTTLLDALCSAALESGASVIAGSAAPHEDSAYAAFLAAAYEAGADLVTPFSGDDERLRRFETFAAALESRSRRAPLLVALEDLHWAGGATFDLLRYLILRLSSAAILFAVTYREFEVNRTHPLRTLRRQLAKMHRGTSLALSSLSRDDVRELAALRAGRTLPDDLVRRIYDRSDGNPLFVSEIVRELRQDGGERVPTSISDIVRARVERLAPAARSFLQTASIAGASVSPELLGRVSGLREADVLQLLDELVSSHFLRQSGGENFSFVHEVIREAVYEQIDAPTARSAHGRVGLALRALHGEHFNDVAATAARHFEIAGMDDAAAGAYIAAAEHALEVYASEEGAAYAGKALQIVQHKDDRFRALRVAELAAGRLARREEQRTHLEELLRSSDSVSAEQRAGVLLRYVDFCSGEPAESAREALVRLEQALPDSPQLTAAYLLRRGEYLSRIGEAHEASIVLRRALDRFAATEDADALLRCLSALYVTALYTGDSLEEIAERVNAVRASVERGSDARVAAQLAFIQAAAAMDRDPQRAAALSELMLEHARAAGDVWLEALAHRSWGASATRSMQLGLAARHLRRCAEITLAAGRLRDLARVRSWQIMLQNRCANFSAAERFGEEALEAAHGCGAWDIVFQCLGNLGNTAVFCGDLDRAEHRVREALRIGEERNYTHPSMRSLLGEILIAKGELAEGIAVIERGWQGASHQDDALNTRRVHVPILLGLAYAAAGRPQDARPYAQSVRAELPAFESYYIHPQMYLWSAAQLLRMFGFSDDAASFEQAARRRYHEILRTIEDEPSRETFRRFVFNRAIEDGVTVDDPITAWYLPHRMTSAPARVPTSRRGARR
jgi:DNA-binding SARP family transcriptional activator